MFLQRYEDIMNNQENIRNNLFYDLYHILFLNPPFFSSKTLAVSE